MEAIYFGNIKVWGYGTGNGPWVMADLENGLFSGVNAGYNANDPTVNNRFLTAIVKGEPNHWAIRAGNAQSGSLSTFYNGARPNVSGYNPMKKEGAIILGIGGDNSIGAAGTFYEGVMTSGYPTDATENAVQANITAAGYGAGGQTTARRRPAERRDRGQPVRPLRRRAERHHHQRHPGRSCGTATAATNQRWTYTSGKQLQVYGNKCLDANGKGTTNGTTVDHLGLQRPEPTSSGTSTPTAPSPACSPGCAWTPTRCGTANGTKIILWACNGGTNQQWSLRT